MAMLKGVEEFVYVLAAAIIVLLVLGLIFAWVPIPSAESIKIAEFSGIGTIGYIPSEPSRTEALGSFVVGQTQTETLKSVPQVYVSAGLFGSGYESYDIEIPDYMLDAAENVKIGFKVYNTNQYGNLVIRWNGLEVFNEKAGLTDYSVTISSDYLEEDNTLEIFCTGPGFAFWASTVYLLHDFEAELEYGPATMIPFQLTQAELGSLNRIGLSFIGTADCLLSIDVNGNGIYTSKPSGVEEAEFSTSTVPLNTGNNIISFSTVTGTANLQNVMLDIYLATNLVTRTRDFNLTDIQYMYLQQDTMQGKIEYSIDEVGAQGSLEVRLNGHVLNTPIPEEGENMVYFDSSEAQEGDNTLSFTGTGQFEIGDVTVWLEV